jgi:hypothetical protein
VSLVKTYSVFCDSCNDWVAEVTSSFGGGTEARREARAHGWKRIDGRDVCPRCQADVPKPGRSATVEDDG